MHFYEVSVLLHCPGYVFAELKFYRIYLYGARLRGKFANNWGKNCDSFEILGGSEGYALFFVKNYLFDLNEIGDY